MTARIVVDGQAPSWAHALARQVSTAIGRRTLDQVSIGSLPPAKPAGQILFVRNSARGFRPAYSDGAKWRFVSDDAEVS
jgi:hypothetical protein